MLLGKYYLKVPRFGFPAEAPLVCATNYLSVLLLSQNVKIKLRK